MTRMRRALRVCLALGLAVAAAWTAGATQAGRQPAVILISFDGFRPDYIDRFDTPALHQLMQSGVRAEHLVPVFPTKTFPNHYTMVTGLYPDRHGIVFNDMFDPVWRRRFDPGAIGTREYDEWWDGEPIWVTVRKQGGVSSTMFWPGSDAAIHGWRPTDWSPYDGSMTNEARVQRVLGWMDRPAGTRPSVITLYLSDADDVGHRLGPASAEVGGAVRRLDAAVGAIVAGLESRKMLEQTDMIVVSDHGMAETSPERVIFLDDEIAMADVDVSDWTPVASIWPKPGREDAVYEKLRGAHPHLSVYRKSELPARWRFGSHRRVAPILGVADEGWSIGTRREFESVKSRWNYGNHGYDNALASMRAIFIARGPSFRRGAVAPPFENIHLYELLCRVLGVRPMPNDGRLEAAAGVLNER